MNFDAYRAVWAAQDAGRLGSPSVLAVAFAMADRTDKTGETRQGVRTLADRVGVSRPTAARAVRVILAAGVYGIAQRSTGHRATRYRLASHGRDANGAVDNAIASHGRDAIASHGSDLASHSGRFSVSLVDASNRTANSSLGVSVSRSQDTPPDEVAANVAELRGRMNGKGGP